MKIITTLAISLMLLAGCATTHVPPDRIYKTSHIGKAVDASESTLKILRPSGLGGGGCGKDVYVDFQRIGEIRRGEELTLHVTAGRHIIEVVDCWQHVHRQEIMTSAGQQSIYTISF